MFTKNVDRSLCDRELPTVIKIFTWALEVLAGFISSGAFASVVPPKNGSWTELAHPGATIRVRLTEGASQVTLRGFDLEVRQGVSQRPVQGQDRESVWELRCQSGRVRAITGGKVQDLQEPVAFRSPSGFVNYQGRPFREEVRINSAGSLCEVVNEVDLEKYLDGLVNSEFSSRWNEEAVAAQVIAARTYALYQIHQAKKSTQHYDVDASVHDQVYDGSIREDYLASRAVAKSKGLVLVTPSVSGGVGEPIKAFYHSS